MHHKYQRETCHQCNGCEIFDGVVRQILVQNRINRHGTAVCQDQCVTVRGGLCDSLHANHIAAASFVFYDESLSKLLSETLRHLASEDVSYSSRGNRDDDFHGSIRIGLSFSCSEKNGARHDGRKVDASSAS